MAEFSCYLRSFWQLIFYIQRFGILVGGATSGYSLLCLSSSHVIAAPIS